MTVGYTSRYSKASIDYPMTYTKVVCKIKPNNEGGKLHVNHCLGNSIIYPYNVGTKTGYLETVKLVSNSIISCPNA